MTTTVLISLAGGAAAILVALPAILKSRKGQVTCTVAAIILIGFMTWRSAWQESETQRNRELLLDDAYRRLFAVSEQLVVMVREAAVQSSDGWLPSNISEVCSDRVAELLCERFDTRYVAPVEPGRSWLDYFVSETKRTKSEIEDILSKFGPDLGSDLTRPMIELKDSVLIADPEQLAVVYARDKQNGTARPQTLCIFGNIKDPQNVDAKKMLTNSLHSLCELYEHLLPLAHGTPVPMPTEYETLRMARGQARLKDETLKQWEDELAREDAENAAHPKPLGRFVPVKP